MARRARRLPFGPGQPQQELSDGGTVTMQIVEARFGDVRLQMERPGEKLRVSEERAFAVKRWLEQKAPNAFPEGRIRVVAHGQQEPVASNTTKEGRAKNRRVVVVLGTGGEG